MRPLPDRQIEKETRHQCAAHRPKEYAKARLPMSGQVLEPVETTTAQGRRSDNQVAVLARKDHVGARLLPGTGEWQCCPRRRTRSQH